VTIRVRAPATTANVGPGFDAAGIALDLWNEVEVGEGPGDGDERHLGVRAFARIASPRGRTFEWVDRIPRARGLGSSAAVVALGLTAGALAIGRDPDPEWLLYEGIDLEGHGDNLAPALAGGVCLTWEGRIARIADAAPAVPIALIPETAVSTAASRAALPKSVPHADAAFSAGRAALLGAALASGSLDLFTNALADKLHEPYRAGDAPLLEAVRSDLPGGAVGATLSGSGPTVLVWADAGAIESCSAELEARFPDVRVQTLAVSAEGAGPF
jgi:homoserine kinase